MSLAAADSPLTWHAAWRLSRPGFLWVAVAAVASGLALGVMAARL
ncbi:hypothetical protein [Tepidimonas sp.]|nr:hypothetical protein [Tepidimonas sp.]MDT7928923.1 hypothetical protein [Tepidimonas sp.]